MACVVACVGARAEAQDANGDAGDSEAPAEVTSDETSAGDEEQAPETPSPERVEAERRYAVAVDRADAGDCEFAVAEFEEIYRLLENPVVFFNMAVCYEELHRYDRAIASYQRYLDEEAPDGASRGEVERSLRRLEGFLGTIQVTANVAASVWIDDREVGPSPGSFRVPAGSHVVELRAAAHEPAQREVTVASGQTAELTLTLTELAEEYGGLSSGFFWTSSALAAVSLGVTVGLGIETLGAESAYRDSLATAGGYESALLEERRLQPERLAIATDVLLGTTVLFATAAVIFALLTDWGGDDEAASARLGVQPAIGPQGAGVFLDGAF